MDPPLAWVNIRLLSGGEAELCAVRRGSSVIKKTAKGNKTYPGNCKTCLGGRVITFPKKGRKKGEVIKINGFDVAVMEDAYTPPPLHA